MGDNSVRPCDCAREVSAEDLLSRAKIPKRYSDCSFNTFHLPSDPRDSLRDAFLVSMRFVELSHELDYGLFYLGPCGVGKTHLAVAVLRALILEQGFQGLFYDFRDLLKEIQDSYNPNTHTSEFRILAPVFAAEILVLDELGASKPTDWVQETITHIITKRCNDKKLTIFTSNYLDFSEDDLNRDLEQVRSDKHRDEIRKKFREESLRGRVGGRLRSRLFEMCKFVQMEGTDYREVVKSRDKW